MYSGNYKDAIFVAVMIRIIKLKMNTIDIQMQKEL